MPAKESTTLDPHCDPMVELPCLTMMQPFGLLFTIRLLKFVFSVFGDIMNLFLKYLLHLYSRPRTGHLRCKSLLI